MKSRRNLKKKVFDILYPHKPTNMPMYATIPQMYG